MKALAITHKGIEDITSLEINELIKTKTTTKETCVIFEPKAFEEIALICYKAQSVKKILYLLDSFKINSLEDLKNVSKSIKEISKFITKDKTFAVRCDHIENENLERDEICITTANALKLNAKVDLETPDITIFVYIYKNDCYLGIDFSGEDISKRDYRIYTHYDALKGTIAYSLLRIADYKKQDIILDPFCGSGTILIEAALFANNFSQNFYSKDKFAFLKFKEMDLEKFDLKQPFNGKIIGYDIELKYIISAKKNAKIAGIEKSITFSRVEIKDLDIKLKEKSIDKIITNPPNQTYKNQRTIERAYNGFFQQANFILKNNGTITIITRTFDLIKKSAKNNKFKILKQRNLDIGKEQYEIIVFKK
ncbi:hypothetical protein CEE44_03055 [Candidatus Woesearchaeota archaeon B3_Woes]|nr:MAG: hypothetical protein CEE44_03055 [Candidatus Woesearchaeota archaeon B3_Woes]